MAFNDFIDEKMRKKYMERRVSEIPKMLKAIEDKDFATLEMMGHKMKGIASSFGFSILSELGEKLEEAAKNKNLTQIEIYQKQIGQFLIEYKFN